ncbi:Fe-S synthesis ferridoxin [Pontimonas salivibrio]|uniref:Fe-S synthesis ferridoxin n=1 Tax=Pontimonas salivibrio TaxID=1159327 RepID=A0A2L2BQR8_9MICO|nr:non-heme iron oxygenase ferredoxin subunit [Pontimonas salivibrio]AVG24011.1 Fe-S synthesis ferridoxin [Pontimonas salivibrio]
MSEVLVCKAEDVAPGTALKVTIDGVPIALVKDSAGDLHAIGDTCSHGEISLSEGFVEDDALECWAHGSQFDLRSGKPRNFPAFEPVPVYQLNVKDGEVYIDPTVTVGENADA